MDYEKLLKVFNVAYRGRLISARHGRENALLLEGEDYDVDVQVHELEDFLREEFEALGLTVTEAIEMTTTWVEENNDWEHLEDATFLQFFG